MELLTSLFVGKPLNILASAVLFLVGYLVLRYTALGISRHPRSLLIATAAWGLYAAWEWLVQIKTPEANIRVDLMLIWPIVLIISIWFAIRAFR
jgi:ABC-type proline/glycine betaine transport system permease subunit